MGFLWWGRKEEDNVEDLKEEVKDAFSKVKTDLKKTGEWINHLHTRDSHHENNIKGINERLSSIEEEIEEIKRMISFFGPRVFKQLSKQVSTGVGKQTAVEGVQTRVQTAVQADFLRNLSAMERVIVWILLNTELRLSYEDVASVLGKERSTIRGQINAIRQKNEGLIEEVIEKNGKKRLFIPEDMREEIVKTNRLPSIRGRRRAKGVEVRESSLNRS